MSIQLYDDYYNKKRLRVILGVNKYSLQKNIKT